MRVATIRQSVARGLWGRASMTALGTLAIGLMAGTSEAGLANHVWQRVDRDWEAGKGPLEVSVQIENRRAPLYQSSAKPDRWYIEAREGAKYQVTVHNTSGERLAFVIAVDGLNAINGNRSSLASSEPMYVLGPYQTTTIKGWRRNLNKVARFVFVDEERSYAERTNQANGDLGWIRVAAFREQRSWISQRREVRERADGASPQAAPEANRGMGKDTYGDSRAAPQTESNPGTGWGRDEKDRVREVEFRPEPFAVAQVIVRYEYHSGLVSLGILPWHDTDRTRQRDRGEYGFALPPPR